MQIATQTPALSPAERSRLVDCERVIKRGLTTFVEVGEALAEIRDSRLYRVRHATFEDYCRERWQLSRPRAYELIGAAAVVENLSGMPDIPLPANERQAGPLKVLEPEQQRDAWQDALEEAGEDPVTSAHVKKAVEKLRAEPQNTPGDYSQDIPDGSQAEEVEQDSEPDVDPIAALEHEITLLQSEVEALSADDKDAELRKRVQKAAQWEGLVRQQEQTISQLQESGRYKTGLLADVRKALDVKGDKEILPAIAALKARAG